MDNSQMSALVFNVFVDKRSGFVNDVGDALFLGFPPVFPFGVFNLKLLSIRNNTLWKYPDDLGPP
jgi:hypothetical protein